MSSIFLKIINRTLPAHIVLENSDFIAFLDIYPLALAHTLVVPKKQVDYFFDLDDKSLSDIILFSKKISKALMKVTKCNRIGISVIGLEVPHAHIHLIPLNKMDDMDFSKKRVTTTSSELSSICKKIQFEII